MAKYPVIKAEKRTETGRRAVRKLRTRGLLPAVFYGPGTPNEVLSVNAAQMLDLIESRTKMVEISLGKSKHPAVIKEIQFDQLGSDVQHVDFEAIKLGEAIKFEVPIETHGTPKGSRNGGVLDVIHRHLNIECKPDDLITEIIVEVADLDIGDTVTVADLPVAGSIKVLDDPSTVIIALRAPRKAVEEEVEVDEEEMAEPEVIGAKKEEGGEAEEK